MVSNAKRTELVGAGRGAAGTTAFVGAKDRVCWQDRAKVIKETDVDTLVPFAKRNTAQWATVYPDEAAAYALPPTVFNGIRSAAHKHSVKGHVPDQMHTIGVASCWLMLEWERQGTFHEGRHETPSSARPDLRGQAKSTGHGHAHANRCRCHGAARQADRVPSARRQQLAFPAPRDLNFSLDIRVPDPNYGCSG